MAKFLIGYHWLLLTIALLLACVSVPLSQKLQFDWQVESMFPPGDPLVACYHRLQDRFGANEIVLAVYRDPELWDESGDGLSRLSAISDQLTKVDGVAAVLSLAELYEILETLRGPIKFLKMGSDSRSPLLDEDDPLAQAMLQVFEGYTHRPSSRYTAIACLLSPKVRGNVERGPASQEATLQRLRTVMSQLPAPAADGFIAGEPVLVSEGFRLVERDGWRLGLISAVLVSIVLLACFRSIRWTLIPLIVVYWALAATRSVLFAMQLDLTMISSTLTAIVTVVGVATSIHLLLRFQQMRRGGLSRKDALQESFSALIAPISWACITDAVGFLALTSAAVRPIRDFGLMMAVGSMMVLVAIVLLVPGLALIGSWDTDPRTPKIDLLIRLWLRRVLEFSLAHRRFGLAILLVLTMFGVIGCILMRVETDFTKNFARSSPLVRGYEVIERELGGAGVWDVMLPAPASIGNKYLALVLELESELRSLSVADGHQTLALSKVLSMADAEAASRAGPFLAAFPLAARLKGMQSAMPDFCSILLTPTQDSNGYRWLRIMLRSRERVEAQAKNELVRAVNATVANFTQRSAWLEQFHAQPPRAEVTGYHVMLIKLVSSILTDQWKCFLLATAGILFVISLATRSLKLALVAIAPNALPITLVLGTMGWLGIQINMGAAMIAAVSLGLSVDSSIHYLLHFRRAMSTKALPLKALPLKALPLKARPLKKALPLKALQSAQENVGLAVVLSTAALVAGFMSLATSEFIPTVVFGTLASLTLLGGLLGNLVLLPLLVAPRG